MSGLKTYGAIAIMIGCFAIVYPRFMHPLLANIFGSGDASRKDSPPMYPPSYKGGNPSERGGGGGQPEDVRKHMRHGPHPGMRAAAEMQRQQSQQGSGRGMMGVVLPMYAVGIVLYLGYTLYKVFNKTNAKNGGRYAWDKTSRYNSGDRDRMGFPKDCDGRSSEIRNFLHDQEHRQNLEDLLTRVDDKNVSVEEMRVLQQRLEETEAQMTRILQAMRGINTNVDNLATGEMGSQVPQGNNTANGDGSTMESGSPREGGGADGEEDSNVPASGNAGGKDHHAADEDESSEEQGNNSNTTTTRLDAGDEKDGDGKEDGDKENTENHYEQQQEEDDDVVDEVMPEKNDDDEEDKDATTEVRQRIVKSNEQ